MTNSNLNEGLTRNALENLIMPIVSIDEYESKISDKRAIVLGFFVTDEDPANDLSRFVDRSSHAILDTEVSPAPTPDGYFLVFVEIQRDENFPKVVMDLIDDVSNLCEIDQWTFQYPQNNNDPIPLSIKNLKKHLILNQDEILELPDEDSEKDEVAPADDSKELNESIDFWKSSMVDSVAINNDQLTLSRYNNLHHFKILECATDSTTILPDHSDARWLQSLLGPSYAVFATTTGLLIEHHDSQRLIQKLP